MVSSWNFSEDSQAIIQKIIDKEGKSSFKKLASKRFKEQGIKWMVLFKLNHDGFESIHAAKNKIDSVMCNLGQVDDDGRALSYQVFKLYY